MRRFLSVAAATAVSVGLLVPAAHAAAPSISYKGLPSDWTNDSINCTTFSPVALNATHVSGPASPPDGSGSLKVVEASGTSGGIKLDVSSTEPSLSTLTAFDAYLYAASSGGAPASLLIEAFDPTTNLDYEFSLDLATPDQWVHLDAMSQALSWQSWNDTSGTAGASGNETLASFLGDPSHANVKLDQLVVAGSCDPGAFYVDALNYAVGSTADTIDFEAPLPATLVNFSRPASVLSGTSVTLGARLSSSSAPLAGQTVSLYSHGVGTSTYRFVKSLVTDGTGAVSTNVTNSSTTTYQWRYTGAGTNYAAVNASAFTIVSRQRVVVTTKPTTTRYGATAHVDGYIRPIKGGVKARLIRLVAGKRIVVATVSTGPRGVFNFYTPLKVRGTYTYLVSALPYPGQDLGQSATFKITTK